MTEDAYFLLSVIYQSQNRLPESEEMQLKFISAWRKEYGDNLMLADRVFMQGWLHLIRGKLAEAETLLHQSIAIYQRKNYHHAAVFPAYCHFALGVIDYSRNRLKEAETALTKTAEILLKIPVQGTPLLPCAYLYLGEILVKQNRLIEAEGVLLKAVANLKALYGEDNIYLPRVYVSLAQFHLHQGKFAEYELYISKMTVMLQKQGNDSEQAYLHGYLATLFLEQGKLHAAETSMVKCIDILVKQVGETHRILSQLYYILGNIYFAQKRLPEAELIYIKAIEKMKLLPDEHYPYLMNTYKTLCDIYMSAHRYPEAELVAISLIEAIHRRPEEPLTNLAYAYLKLGLIYLFQRKLREAEQFLRLSLNIQPHEEISEQIALAYSYLTLVCLQSHRLEETKDLLLIAIEKSRGFAYIQQPLVQLKQRLAG